MVVAAARFRFPLGRLGTLAGGVFCPNINHSLSFGTEAADTDVKIVNITGRAIGGGGGVVVLVTATAPRHFAVCMLNLGI